MLGHHLDGFGDVECAHDRTAIRRRRGERVEDCLRGLRIDVYVPLVGRRGVARMLERATHDHQALK